MYQESELARLEREAEVPRTWSPSVTQLSVDVRRSTGTLSTRPGQPPAGLR
jgi:hypothetical protein